MNLALFQAIVFAIASLCAVASSQSLSAAANSSLRENKSSSRKNLYSRNLNSQQSCDTNPLDPTSSTSGTGYHTWMSSLAPDKYPHVLYMPTVYNACNGLAFHWNTDEGSSKIHIAVAAKASGWVALGFSETGGMKGADIVYYEASSGELVDAHVGDGYFKPTRDVIQDWTLVSSQVTDDGYIIFEAERALFTNFGHEDHLIQNDSGISVKDHKIIGAWGDTASIGFHNTNVVRRTVQLFSSSELEAGNGMTIFRQRMDEKSDGSATLVLDNYEIPTQETTYYDVCFTVDDLVAKGLYKDDSSPTNVIGFEFLIDQSVVEYVHHITIQGSSRTDSCDFDTAFIAAWTPGDDFLMFPEGMGLEFAGGEGADNDGDQIGIFRALRIEYHFDNPGGVANEIDTGSGVRIYYSNEPADVQLGMLVAGDPWVILAGSPVGEGKSLHELTCTSGCTTGIFSYAGVDEITIVAQAMHTHATGKRVVGEVFRDGESVSKSALDYYDFDQNGAPAVRKDPFIMKKGDSYKTSCYYESDKNTKFGLGSSEEMCMVFIYYYPRIPYFSACGSPTDYFGICKGDYSYTRLDDDSNFDRAMTDTSGINDEPEDSTSSGSKSIVKFSMAHLVLTMFAVLI